MMLTRPKTLITVIVLSSVFVGSAFWWWPHNPEREFEIGWAELNRGRWQVVRQQIERLRQHPGHSDAMRLLRGGLLLRMGDPDTAIQELSKITPDSKHRIQSLLFQCEAHYAQKHWLPAEAVARKLLAINPDNADAHRWLGAIYYDLGAMQAAQDHLMRLAQLMPRDYSPHRLLGLIHMDFERFKEAIAEYQAALECSPPESDRREIFQELARSQIRQSDYLGAIRTLDLAATDDDLEFQMLRAECLWTLNRREEAERLIRTAQQSSPDSAPVLRLSARIAIVGEQTDEALTALEMLVKLDPFDQESLMQLSLVYRRVGRNVEADQFLERRNVAYAFVERMSNLNTQAIREPTNAAVRDELADVCEQLGKSELATMWREAAKALARRK